MVMPKQYPYEIPAVKCPKPGEMEGVRPQRLLEFFRIEALLRSPAVMELYKTGRKDDYARDTLGSTYSVEDGWDVLNGTHHDYLRPLEPDKFHLAEGIDDLGEIAIEEPETLCSWAHDWRTEQEEYRGLPKRTLWLAISTDIPPEAILQKLRPILRKRYVPTKPSPIKGYRGFKTWLDYFKCYDLRHHDRLEYGPVAEKVYGTRRDAKERGKVRDRAEKAVVHVTRLIKAAERNDWPPSKL